jgi:catechol 2,3-dioxygenase-like lactoylglutathione lyase family enzyme
MLKRLDHVEIIPADFERSLAFYSEVLGFTVDHRYPIPASPIKEVAYLILNGSAIELLRADPPLAPAGRPLYAGYRLMAWEVDDMYVRHVARAGGKRCSGQLGTPDHTGLYPSGDYRSRWKLDRTPAVAHQA